MKFFGNEIEFWGLHFQARLFLVREKTQSVMNSLPDRTRHITRGADICFLNIIIGYPKGNQIKGRNF